MPMLPSSRILASVRSGSAVGTTANRVSQNAHARLFASKFTAFAPVIRRATSSERGEILLGRGFDAHKDLPCYAPDRPIPIPDRRSQNPWSRESDGGF